MVEINVVYTKTGDDGDTCLASEQRISKSSARINAIGDVDELNCHLGLAVSQFPEAGDFARLKNQIQRIQNQLFNLGSELALMATESEPAHPHIKVEETLQLEHEIDTLNKHLPSLQSFILPGGSLIAAQLHVCRSICRRAERSLVALNTEEGIRSASMQFINRLSDWLFVTARHVLRQQQRTEKLWQP